MEVVDLEWSKCPKRLKLVSHVSTCDRRLRLLIEGPGIKVDLHPVPLAEQPW